MSTTFPAAAAPLTAALTGPAAAWVPASLAALTDEDLRTIVDRASSHWERLGLVTEPGGTAERRSARWRSTIGEDAALFEKRLRWDGLTPSEADRALRIVQSESSTPLPEWTSVLRECIEHVEVGPHLTGERFLDAEKPVPFEDLIGHFVVAARHLLNRRAPGPWPHVTDAAAASLERHLLVTLSNLCAAAFHVSFSVERALVRSVGRPGHTPAEDATYKSFVVAQRRGGLRSLLREFSVLARHVATTVDAWVANSARLLSRLHTDWFVLTERLLSGAEPGPVIHFSAGLSDPHRGHQTTHILRFEDGLRIVYKPRSLDICAAFQGLIRWCNAHGTAPALLPTDVLPRKGYGWMAYVNAGPCADIAAVQDFYERAGALLCLVYALNGHDMHRENILAAGPHPVLIDLEALFSPPLRRAEIAGRVSSSNISNSVRFTGLLPVWKRVDRANGEASFANAGGLCDFGEIPSVQHVWSHVNTDRMARTSRTTKAHPGHNLPTYDDARIEATEYVSDILRGFERMYHLLQANTKALLASDGPIAAFADLPARHLFRDTKTYYALLRKLKHPQFLRDGADGSVELDVLTHGYLKLAERPPYWPVIAAESADLSRLDIPIFNTRTTDDRLFAGDGTPICTCFESTGYDAVRDKLQSFSADDLLLQRELIRGSFLARPTSPATAASPGDGGPSAPYHLRGHAGRLTPEAARDEARCIARKIMRARLTTNAGLPTWMTLRPSRETGLIEHTDVGLDVYEGCSGIALFLAALAQVDGDADMAEAAREAARPLLQWLSRVQADRIDLATEKIGGLAGLSSYAYAMVRLGVSLDDDEVLDSARVAASLVTPDRISADTALDVVSGAAGAALALLALHRTSGDFAALDAACRCGYHLLEQRQPDPVSGLRAWPTLEGQLHTGFSHGAAGIGHALAELFRSTGNSSFLDAALEAFAFERSLFDADLDNWHRHPVSETSDGDSDGRKPWSTWCHGAPGIGLARAANLDLYGPAEKRDLDAALATTESTLFRGNDHVCCGAIGRIQTLATAARSLERADLHQKALEAAQHVVDRSRARGAYALSADGCEFLRPTFFQGLAGVGHTLLHLTHPETVPPVALLA